MKKHRTSTYRRIALPSMLLASFAVVHAGPRASTNYSITTDTTDGGGKRATSAAYTNDGSAGGITGISTVVSPAETAKAGYMGQITEVTALQLAATPASVNETDTLQLGAAQLLVDGSLISLAATDGTWGVASGPLSGIDATGLASAGSVYRDTAAVARGDYAGTTGSLDLIVFDSIRDNFGSYAGDGLADDWQFDHFGLDNPLAGPSLDPDGDGQNNLFEFTAGLVPTDSHSRFIVTLAPVPGQTTQKRIVFEPVVDGRSYTVVTSPDLGSTSWDPLTDSTTSDNGGQRTVTDTSATQTRKFYSVEITKP